MKRAKKRGVETTLGTIKFVENHKEGIPIEIKGKSPFLEILQEMGNIPKEVNKNTEKAINDLLKTGDFLEIAKTARDLRNKSQEIAV